MRPTASSKQRFGTSADSRRRWGTRGDTPPDLNASNGASGARTSRDHHHSHRNITTAALATVLSQRSTSPSRAGGGSQSHRTTQRSGAADLTFRARLNIVKREHDATEHEHGQHERPRRRRQ